MKFLSIVVSPGRAICLFASFVLGCAASEPITLGGGAAGSAGGGESFGGFVGTDLPPVTRPQASATGGGGTGGSAARCGASPGPLMRGPSPFRPEIGAQVMRAATPPRPISGGTLHVLADGSAAVASDPDGDRLFVVDLRTRTVRGQIALHAGDEPGRIVEDAAGQVHVALRGGGALLTLDPLTVTVTGRRAACAAPRGVAYQPTTDLVHVACAGGEMVSFPAAAAGAPVRTLKLPSDLRDVVVVGKGDGDGGGKLLVSTFRRAEALVLDGSGAVIERLRPPARQRPSMTSPTGVQTLSPSVAWRMVPTAAGGAVMVHQRGVDDEVAIDGSGYAGGKGCDGVVESAVTPLQPGQVPTASPGMAMTVLAVDVAMSPDGRHVAVVAAGNAHTPMPQLTVSDLTDMTQPNGGCLSGPGAAATAPGQLVAVDYTPTGTIVTQSREPAALWLADGDVTVALAQAPQDPPVADTGHLLFHVNAGGGIACASCHPEGGDDGRVWKFSCLGPRRTQSMRGGISGTAPFHWDGDMQTFSALVDQVFVGRMAGPPLDAAQGDALLGWIDTIPLLPPSPVDAAAAARGRALFNDPSVGCSACHAGTLFTNNATVDVGTGLALQVPSLRGVGARAPYLHTGCAPALSDRFGACGGGDKHGHTSQLAPAQLADLTAYLSTI